MSEGTKKPVYEAFAVIERKQQKPWYQSLGAVFETESGNGLNVVLHATPLNGRLLLLPFKEKERGSSSGTE